MKHKMIIEAKVCIEINKHLNPYWQRLPMSSTVSHVLAKAKLKLNKVWPKQYKRI